MINKVIIYMYLIIILTGCIKPSVAPSSPSSLDLISELKFTNNIRDFTYTDNFLFVEDGVSLFAYSIDGFSLLWEREIEQNAEFDGAGIIVFDDQLIVSSEYKIITLDLEGNALQEFIVNDKNDGYPLVSSVSNDVILVTRPGSWNIEAYERTSGNLLWKKYLGRGRADVYYNVKLDQFIIIKTSFISMVNSWGQVYFEDSVDNGYYLFNSYDNNDTIIYQKIIKKDNQICSFSITARKENWCIAIPFEASSVYVFNDTFFITQNYEIQTDSTIYGTIQAYSTINGNILWSQRTDPLEPPIINFKNGLYIRDSASSSLYVFDSFSGKAKGFFAPPFKIPMIGHIPIEGKEILTNGTYIIYPYSNILYIFK
jgi:hypothetical protein